MGIINTFNPGTVKKLDEAKDALSHYKNYKHIDADPDAVRTPQEKAMDAIGNVGFRNFLANAPHIPEHPSSAVTDQEHDGYIPRDTKKVSSDALVDSIMVVLTNKIKDPKEVLASYGKDNVAFNEALSVLAIRDPYSEKGIRAFKVIVKDEDFHDKNHPNPNATGYANVTLAELKVDPVIDPNTHRAAADPVTHAPVYPSLQKFVDDHGKPGQKLKYEPNVRSISQGFQANYDTCPQTGQLDREDLPTQLARVSSTNEHIKEAMKEAGMLRGTKIHFTSHSLGVGNTLLQRWDFEHDADLKARGYKVGDTTVIEQAGEGGVVKKIATMIAAEKMEKGDKTANIETEVANLTRHVDVVANEHESYIRKFQLGTSPEDAKTLGAREFRLPMVKPELAIVAAKSTELGTILRQTGEPLKTTGVANHGVGTIAGTVLEAAASGYTGMADAIKYALPFGQFPDHFSEGVVKNMLKDKDHKGLILVEHLDFATPRELADHHPDQKKNTTDQLVQNAAFAMLSVFQATDPTESAREQARLNNPEPYFAEILRDMGKRLNVPEAKTDELITASNVPVNKAAKQNLR